MEREKWKGENTHTHLRRICIYGFNYVRLPKPHMRDVYTQTYAFFIFLPLCRVPFQACSGSGRHIVNRNWSLHSSAWNLFLSPLPDGCCLALLVSDLRNARSDLSNQQCSSLWIKNSLLEILCHTHAVFLGLWNICSLWNIWTAQFSAVEIFVPLLLASLPGGLKADGVLFYM